MLISMGSTGRAALLAMTIAIVAGACPALGGQNIFIGGADNTDNSWQNPDNWSTSVPGGSTDDVTVNPSLMGAVIPDGDGETIQSLNLLGGLNVNRGGALTVTGNLTNTGTDGAYFINDGTIIVDGIITNTCPNCADSDPDNDTAGYIGNTFAMTGDLDNAGAAINGDGTGLGTWNGDVVHNAAYVANAGGTWTGDVLDNGNTIYNQNQGTWIGNVVSNSAYIENNGGSSWTGVVVANGVDGLISNLGGTWQGDVETNDGSIANNGGTWNGNVLANTGSIGNATGSVWNGNITSSGVLGLAGTVNGDITNQGGLLFVLDPLSGVHGLSNTGEFNMDDGDADDSLGAQSWSGTGTATFNFAPALGRADHVVLSGDYSGVTDLNLSLVGPSGRAYRDVSLLSVGGDNTGSLTVSGLPEDGVISYRLVQSSSGFVIAASLSQAPAHVASALALMGDAVVEATQVPTDRGDACGEGGWARALGNAQSGRIGDAPSDVGLGGVQVGYDLTCIAMPGATLGIGMTGGGYGGRLSQDFGGDRLNGSFQQGFAGLYGNLVAGSLRAVLQGQFDFGSLSVNDPDAALDGATMSTTRFDLSGSASYALALGGVRFAPEIGFAASAAKSRSTDFADVGAMSLENSPALDAYVGATLSGDVVLPDGATTLTPFASLSLHGDLLADTARFTAGAGGSATLPVDTAGSYVALSFGANAAHTLSAGGQSLDAGLKTGLRFGPDVADASLSGYARVRF